MKHRIPSLPARRVALVALAICSAALGLAFTTPACAYAELVLLFLPGPAASGDLGHPLGAPTGQGLFSGSGEVLTLGVGGSLTLQLASSGFDGPGTDLLVCENPFYVVGTSGVFVEAMFVDVSTDGTHFVRFPTSYTGPAGPFLPQFGQPVAGYRGFAGVMPVSANPSTGVSDLDIAACGGDAFDYADLAGLPEVLNGSVDLFDIEYVRLVDAESGVALDSTGHVVWDCGLDSVASADVDAIVAVNSACVATGGRPRVEMTLVNGFITIRIEDSDGFKDVKHGLKASVNALPLSFASLLPFFFITAVDPLGITLVTGPVPPGAFPVTLKVSAQDSNGLFGGDSLTLP